MTGGSRTTAALLASLLAASPALAQPRKPPSEKDRRTAGDLVRKAIALSGAGDHSAAIEVYLQAYTVVPDSILLSNIGAEFQQNGRPQEALRYFCMYLEKEPKGTNAPYATSQARSLQIQLGNKDVDDEDVCAPPRPKPRPRPEPRDREPEPDPPPKLRPRDPEPIVRDEPAVAPAPSGNPTLRYAGIAVGAAGLIAVGIGAYAGTKAKAISDEISSQDPELHWRGDIQDFEAKGQRYEDLQIRALVAGGLLVTTGVILYVLGRPDSAAERTSNKTVVRVSPTTNGFAVFGRF